MADCTRYTCDFSFALTSADFQIDVFSSNFCVESSLGWFLLEDGQFLMMEDGEILIFE